MAPLWGLGAARFCFGTGAAAAMQAVGRAMQGCRVPGEEVWRQRLAGTRALAMCSGCFPPALPWPRGLAVCSVGCDNSSRVLEPASLEGPAWIWWAGGAQVSIIPKRWEPWSQVISYCRELQSNAWKHWDVLGSWLSWPRGQPGLGHAALRRAALCHLVPCCTVPCHVVLCHAVPCHMVLCDAMLYRVMLCHLVLCHMVLCHTTLCCAAPRHAVLCCHLCQVVQALWGAPAAAYTCSTQRTRAQNQPRAGGASGSAHPVPAERDRSSPARSPGTPLPRRGRFLPAERSQGRAGAAPSRCGRGAGPGGGRAGGVRGGLRRCLVPLPAGLQPPRAGRPIQPAGRGAAR